MLFGKKDKADSDLPIKSTGGKGELKKSEQKRKSGASKKVKKGGTEKKVSTKGLTREDVYKKPPLAQLYDKMNPGDYTIKQDFYHSLFIFAFIAIIIICIAVMGISSYVKDSNLRSSQLVIPHTMFVSGQEDNVVQVLGDSGFVDIGFDEDGNMVAHGTANMTQQYKDSFYDKHIKPLEGNINGDLTEYGIESIVVSDDAKTLTIRTYRNLAGTSVDLSGLVENDTIAKIISEYSAWCGIRNDGEAMTTTLVNVMDLTDGSNGTEYYSSTRPTGSQMVADMEKKEKEALNAATNQETAQSQEEEESSE